MQEIYIGKDVLDKVKDNRQVFVKKYQAAKEKVATKYVELVHLTNKVKEM